MRSVRAVLSVLSLWAAVAAGHTQAGQAGVFGYGPLQRMTQGEEVTARELTDALEQGEALIADPAELVQAAAPKGFSIDWDVNVTASAQLKWVPTVNWTIQGAKSGLSGSVGNCLFKVSRGPNLGDRVITDTRELVTHLLGNGAVVRHVTTVEVQYGSNVAYYDDLGNPGRELPFVGPMMQAAMSLSDLGAALAPKLFGSRPEALTITLGTGAVIENPLTGASESFMEKVRLKRGQSPGTGVVFQERTVSKSFSADVSGLPAISRGLGTLGKVGKGVSLSAGLGYSVTSSTDPERTLDMDKAKVAAVLLRASESEVAVKATDLLEDWLEAELVRGAVALARKAGVLTEGDPHQIVATPDPEVGGVRVYYDPGMLEADVAPEEMARTLRRFMDQMEQGQESFIVSSATGQWDLHVVSVRDLLTDTDGRTLGPLTRVRGFVLADDGDVLLLGEVNPGEPPIDVDVLVVALRSIWQRGEWPYVSLDPDPHDYGAPHEARWGGVPEELRSSELVRVMLEADYGMKKIELGTQRANAPGLATIYDLMGRDQVGPQGTHGRLWLLPMPSGAADVWEYQGDEGTVMLFDSRVQVLAETTKRAGDCLIGTGGTDTIGIKAADSFTTHYAAIAQHREEFQKLNAVFDACKLSAILRDREIEHPLLDGLAARPVLAVDVADEYDAVGPVRVGGTNSYVAGGANTRMRLTTRSYAQTDVIADALTHKAGETFQVTYPTTVGLSAEEALGMQAEMAVNRGVQAFLDEDYAACESMMDEALQLDDEFAAAHYYRGVARLMEGRYEAALADVDRAVAWLPELQAMRGTLRGEMGDVEGALRDAAEVGAAFPEDEFVLECNAETYILAFDLPQAEATLERLLELSPMNEQGWALWESLGALHSLGPEAARRQVELARAVPPKAMSALNAGVTAAEQLDFATAIEKLERGLLVLDEMGPDSGADAYYLRERIEVALVVALSASAALDRGLSRVASHTPASTAGQAPPGTIGLEYMGYEAVREEDETTDAAAELPEDPTIDTQREPSTQRQNGGDVAQAADAQGGEAALDPTDRAFDYARQLAERRPEWSSVYLLQLTIGRDSLSTEAREALFEKAVQTRDNPDPLMEDVRIRAGSDRAMVMSGLELIMPRPEPGGAGGLATGGRMMQIRTLLRNPVLDQTVALMEESLDRRLLTAYRDALREIGNEMDEFSVALHKAMLDAPEWVPADVYDALKDIDPTETMVFLTEANLWPDDDGAPARIRALADQGIVDLQDSVARASDILTRAVATIPDEAPADPVRMLTVTLVCGTAIALKMATEDMEGAREIGLCYLRSTALEEVTPASAPMVSLLRFGVVCLVTTQYWDRIESDPRWEQARIRLYEGRGEVREVHVALNSARDGLVMLARQETSPFVASALELEMSGRGAAMEAKLQDAADTGLEEIDDPARRERWQRELDGWRRRPHQGGASGTLDDAFAPLRGLVANAESGADIHCVGQLLEMSLQSLQMLPAGMVEGDSTPNFDAQRVKSRIEDELGKLVFATKSKMRSIQAKRSLHDWSGWPGAG